MKLKEKSTKFAVYLFVFVLLFTPFVNNSWWCFVVCSEIQSLQDEIPELRNRLTKTEAELLKAIEGERKASEEVS